MQTTPRSLLAALCCVAMLLYSVYLGAVGVLLPYLGRAFSLGEEAQGRLFPANFAGFVVGVLLCGYLSDRWGRKAVLLIGLAVYAGGLSLFGSAGSYPLALAAALLVGAGSGAMEVVANALAADLYPERRAFLLNALQVAFGVGAAVAPTLCRYLLTHGTDWRWLYFGLAAINGVVFVVLSLCRLPQSAAPEALELAALRAVLQKPSFATLCVMQALYVGAEVSFFSWLPTYFEKQLTGGVAWMAGVGTLFWITMTIGRFALGGLLGRFPLMRLNALAAGGGVVFAALALLWHTPLPVLVCVALAGLFFAGIFSLVLAEAGERFPSVAGTAFGGVVAAGGLGGAVIPWVVGALAAGGLGWQGALALVPLTLTGTLVLSLVLLRTPPSGQYQSPAER
ncbi:MFS transporter [Armatimonas rosea]|uniref:FHS family glucose/mannose:H+ symporter-like MFS transporter n=1 Tax=Armatimonas rosea TaxID=685828 RepID=A0A7W9SSK6_ARMRO|nr:MFS transporter [Armatimonas rosea]MBB6051610.1 FHS family glucose/mannose:H+ symporter-like MFS transporter [Armatimonas rosea]